MTQPSIYPNTINTLDKYISLTESNPDYRKSSWAEWFENGITVPDDFMIDRNQPMPQEREDIFP